MMKEQGHTEAEWYAHALFSDRIPDGAEFLYHFTGVGAFASMALTRELWLTSPRNANDPKEQFGREPVVSRSYGTGSLWVGNNDDSWQQRAVEQHHRLQRTFRICCFALDRRRDPPGIDRASRFDDRAFASTPMWQHYADSHRGACLILDRTAVERSVNSRFGDLGDVMDMVYQPGFSPDYLNGQRVDVNHEGKVTSDIADRLRNALRFKNAHWAYEREARVIIQVEDVANDCPVTLPLADLVVGVAVGYHFDPNHLDMFAEACSALGVDLADTASMALEDTGVLIPDPLLLPHGLHKLTDRERRSRRTRVFTDWDPLSFDGQD